MDVEKIAVFAGVGFALAVGAFVLWGPSPKPRRRGQVVGINNIGYTCFLNALLQALAACPTFTAWLYSQQEKLKKDCFTRTLCSVLEKINGYADDLYGDITPTDVISSLGPLWGFAPGYQDAHELFHIVLNALQSDIQSIHRKCCLSDALPESPMIAEANIEGSGDLVALRSVSCNDIAFAEKNPGHQNGFDKNCNNHVIASAQSMSSVSAIKNKPGMILARSSDIILKGIENGGISVENVKQWNSLWTIPTYSSTTLSNEIHPFSGLLTSQLQCTNCNWKSAVHYDKLETVSLPLTPLGQVRHTLIELFARFVSSEVISDVTCDGCDVTCRALRTLTLGKLPKCLCLHIPRSVWSLSGMPLKRDDPVIFSEFLTLDPFTFTEAKKRRAQGGIEATIFFSNQSPAYGKHKYRLQAVVEHRGPVDSGHFVCFRRGNRQGQWLYTSDTTVESATLTDVLCANPYLLFYERVNQPCK